MSIPIYQLPKNALMNVLKNMDVRSLILISTFSKYSKSLVKSIRLKARNASLDLSVDIAFSVGFQNNNSCYFFLSRFTDNKSQFITVRSDQPNVYFEYPNALMGKLFNHITDIVNCKTVKCHFNGRPSKMEEQFIKDALANLEMKKLLDFRGVYMYDFIKIYPQTRELTTYAFENTVNSQCPLYRKLLIQNFDKLFLGGGFTVDLNALLLINSSSLGIRSLTLTDKDINRFIRCWMNGSNPRLEYFEVCGEFILETGVMQCQEEVIMKNISHEKAPIEQNRTFKLPSDSNYSSSRLVDINGGIDITRKNGTKATILIKPEKKNFQLFVWQ